MTSRLPAVYLAAGEGKRLRPLTDDRPKAMIDVGGVSLAERALGSLGRAGIADVVVVTGYEADAVRRLGDLVSEERFNPRFASAENICSLWCARDVVRRGCYIVNSDVLFEDSIACRLAAVEGSSVLCAADHGVGAESMKAVCRYGRLVRLSKRVPVDSNPEYIGLARVDPAHGPLLAEILERFMEREEVGVYYEQALEELAREVAVGVAAVDGLAWIEIDDHEDLARARDEVLGRVT